MDAAAMTRHITETFDRIQAVESSGDTFFSYDAPGDQWLLFATVVTGDTYDSVSRLSRAGAYRLNIGLTKATYVSRFGPAPTLRDEHGVLETGFDHAVPDVVMPHPHYASQYWVCVVNPAAGTLDDVRVLLDEAYRFAARKHANRSARDQLHTRG
ncbi:hypothetical protein SAMN05444920_1011023 [Nonomuraea solani]|uniref:DUF6194 domain-containing protein n=1 Tax=Nonomuraea solani TaxID=1144553 RepID=A0A1H5VXS4_9ACTN|nr:DUF6194 family protein [Nonomuraea solani]SEF92089.1 hypothetical protein SAMN05444920_1011023 [Nonomuraea solani]